MVKIAVVGGTGNVATELLRASIQSNKHSITIFTRSDTPSNTIPGLSYTKVEYQDLSKLTHALKGFHTCLSFLVTHTDENNTVQKNLIHACIAAGVKRFAPSEWGIQNGSGVAPYKNKDAIAHYLAELKENGKLEGLQYCLFQPSVFLDYFAHPYSLSRSLYTFPFFIDLEKRRAIVLDEGEWPIVVTAATDVSEMLALALDDPLPWPVVGGIQGIKTNVNEIIELGKKIRGGEWNIEHVKSEDVEKGVLKTSWVPVFDHPVIPVESREAFSRSFVIEFLVAMKSGAWNVNDAFNQRFQDYKFIGLEEYLTKAWDGKP